jgi:CheY-like chemotaxis protein
MSSAEPIRILIAEDERGFLQALATYLSSEDRLILTARDGEEALRVLDQEPLVEIIITDLVMPGADGLAVMKRALERSPDALIILMTGYGSIDTAVRAIRSGAFDYKTKPFLLEELGLALHRAEAHMRLRRERAQLIEERILLRARVAELDEELRRSRLAQDSSGDRGDSFAPPPLEVLGVRLSAHDALSSYQRWDLDAPGDEDLAFLQELHKQGAIEPARYRRLEKRLARGQRIAS